MGHALLIAGVEHGPQMHGAALIVLAAIAVVGGLVYLGKRRLESGRRRSNREPASDRSADASDRSRDG